MNKFKFNVILFSICASLFACDDLIETDDDNSNEPLSLSDLSNGEGKVSVYGEVSDSFSGSAVFTETSSFFGATFNPDYDLLEYTMQVAKSDGTGLLTLRFFIEYPPAASDNIEIFTEKYNIIDLNDSDGGGVLYAFPMLQIVGNADLTYSEFPDGSNNYAEIVSVSASTVEGRLLIEDVENDEGKKFTIEAVFKADRE